MIDFLSTRDTTDPETAACARLLTCIISRTIEDACMPPSNHEKKVRRNLDPDVREALHWMFGETTEIFELYASLIGGNAEAIRKALLQPAEGMAPQTWFTESQRRTLRVRLAWEGLLSD